MSRSERGGRLLRRTFGIALLLVSGGLITSGAVELFFRYRESIQAIGALQQEMALGAAFKIQQFVQDIEKTMRASTQTQEIVTAGLTEAYRFELIKLLKVAPPITEATALNLNGREQVKASRVRMTGQEDLSDRSSAEAFVRARGGKSYFSQVYFVRESEPYMTIAVPIERFAGDIAGVLICEVNLKYIWEVISRIKVGKAGYAYVVSGEGDLIAHPDISLVLQKRNLGNLDQVKAALAGVPASLAAQPNLAGQKVFSAYASIPELGWAVLIERPAGEAYAPLYASILRISVLLLLGLGIAVLASLLIGRRVVRPVEMLRQGAARIGAGALDHRIEVRTGDELEALADQFNSMTAQLQESYANLEQKVEVRTRELSEALEQQTATGEILRVISGSPTDIQPVLNAVAENAARLCEARDASIGLVEGNVLRIVASHGTMARWWPEEGVPIDRGSVTGRAVMDRQIVHIDDLAAAPEEEFPRGRIFQKLGGHRTNLAVPLLREGVPIGVIAIRRTEVRPFTEKQIELVTTFADQAVIAIENVRLFQEIQDKGRQLEIANRHKSEFLANMSHELRTPLNAIIGFSEVLLERMFGELNPKQAEYLQDIFSSGRHLLSLINDILDLSKIEAGRMELELTAFDLPTALENALTLVRERASRHGVALGLDVDKRLGDFVGDERKLKQILLNLLSNAVKFTPEGGRVGLKATPADGAVEIAVSDTGIGIAPEDQEAIFEEFRQVGSDYARKREGTGLGLTLTKKFIEMHGGRIWVKSEVGKGSTFTFILPVKQSPAGSR